jgi:GGDEF domain-containing protein
LKEKMTMTVFDRIDPSSLDRRELHLWVLATAMIIILSAGTALLMYPVVSGGEFVVTGGVSRKVFLAFCALSGLLVAYLIERQFVIRQLRNRLVEELRRNVAIRQQASVELLESLPELNHFQDRLSMEFRRSAMTEQPLSLLVVRLRPSRELTASGESAAAYGDAAKAIIRRLRREDSIYLFSPGVFGILLPNVSGGSAYKVAERLTDSLHDASGANERFTFDVRVINYPEHTESAAEMEQAARSFLSESGSERRSVEVASAA